MRTTDPLENTDRMPDIASWEDGGFDDPVNAGRDESTGTVPRPDPRWDQIVVERRELTESGQETVTELTFHNDRTAELAVFVGAEVVQLSQIPFQPRRP